MESNSKILESPRLYIFHLTPVALQRHLDELWPGSYDFCTFLLPPVQQEDREEDNKRLHGGILLFWEGFQLKKQSLLAVWPHASGQQWKHVTYICASASGWQDQMRLPVSATCKSLLSLFNFPLNTCRNTESSWAAELCVLPEEPPSVRAPWPCLSFVGEAEAGWNNSKMMHLQLKLGLSSHCAAEPFTSAGTYGCRNEKAEHLKALKKARDSAAWLTRSFHRDFRLPPKTESLCVQLGRVLHRVKEEPSQPLIPFTAQLCRMGIAGTHSTSCDLEQTQSGQSTNVFIFQHTPQNFKGFCAGAEKLVFI